MSWLTNWLRRPFYIDKLYKYFSREGVRVLDVGCGNDAPVRFKRYFPRSEYSGCDQTDQPAKTEYLNIMKAYYKVDLQDLGNLDLVPNDYFDIIILNHVVEHITNADRVIPELSRKLREDGLIYIETPSEISTHLPSMAGTLNFYDDPTHIKLWTMTSLRDIATNSRFQILKSGRRRSLKRIILFPLYLIINSLQRRPAGAFWDLFGFANYLIGRKTV